MKTRAENFRDFIAIKKIHLQFSIISGLLNIPFPKFVYLQYIYNIQYTNIHVTCVKIINKTEQNKNKLA